DHVVAKRRDERLAVRRRNQRPEVAVVFGEGDLAGELPGRHVPDLDPTIAHRHESAPVVLPGDRARAYLGSTCQRSLPVATSQTVTRGTLETAATDLPSGESAAHVPQGAAASPTSNV